MACIAMTVTTRFVGFASLDGFHLEETPSGLVYVSPLISPTRKWNELVLSWNVDSVSPGSVEATAVVHDGPIARSFRMGRWVHSGIDLSQSFKGQKSADADVLTDTLKFSTPSNRPVQIRLELDGEPIGVPKFIGACFADTSQKPPEEEPFREAWGRTIDVSPISQMSYPNGKVLCSPTCVTMSLQYWARSLPMAGLPPDVPQVASGVFDQTWNGTGNWTFNCAYAGSFPGIRSYVSRFDGITDLERWIAAGIPVACSVSLEMIQGKPKKPEDGHLVLLIGFTKDGDPVFNDPGWSKQVRQTYKRSDFEAAWACSHRTVYLIYPDEMRIPDATSGLWMP